MGTIGTCVVVAGKSSHHLIRAETDTVSALIRWCDDLPTTTTHVPVGPVLVLNTPDYGPLRLKHVEWLCRNKTCTVLHQVGVSFDLYYDARKHKIKMYSQYLVYVILVMLTVCWRGQDKYQLLSIHYEDSWWWTVSLSETCRVVYQNKVEK